MAGQPNWSARELEVVNRFVKALRNGRYRCGAEAARACREQLETMRRRRTGARRPPVSRSENAIFVMFGIRKRAAGVSGPGNRWQPDELRVIERYVTALRDNRYAGLPEAVRECRRELTKLRQGRRRTGPKLLVRSTAAIHQKLDTAVRAAGLTLRFGRRRPDEVRIVSRYVRAYLAGRYPSMRAAAARCRRELARRSNQPRPFSGVYWMLCTTAQAMGLSRLTWPWTPAENRVLNRYLRRLFESRYQYPQEAARDCFRELGGSRSYKAVLYRLRTQAPRVGLPRYHSHLTTVEERFVERYALKVHHGILPHWLAAARQCLAAIQRRTARLARTGPLRLRRPPSHTLDTIHLAILKLAHRRGLRGPRNPHWTAVEDKMAANWVKWYDRYRTVRRLAPLKQAGEGLHGELAEKGFQRSVSACRARVSLKWRLEKMP